MAEVFRRDDERELVFPDHLTELQRIVYSMNHHEEMETTRSTRNIAEVSMNKISVLYKYIKSFTNCADLDVKKSDEKKKKDEKNNFKKANAFYGRTGGSDSESDTD